MVIEFQFLIASFLAFTTGFVAIKLGQALYDSLGHTELFLTQ